ncbi:MAG: sigma factor-like helix-turn-helix DNA-binding protein [Synergistaceae bacterium]
MSELNTLQQRIRDGLLLDTYGSQLTEKQKTACEMILLQDLSLSEAAETLGVSRQGVHDLVTRAREHMEETERSLKILEKEQKLQKIETLIDENITTIPKEIYKKLKKLLKD